MSLCVACQRRIELHVNPRQLMCDECYTGRKQPSDTVAHDGDLRSPTPSHGEDRTNGENPSESTPQAIKTKQVVQGSGPIPSFSDRRRKLALASGESHRESIASESERVKRRAELTAKSFGFKSLSPIPSPSNSDVEDNSQVRKRIRRDDEMDIKRHASSKRFKDQVYGHIELPALCIAVMDTPQFQRLRNLKQLGAAYFVYPGASHNRFEHSIGVAWLAGVLMKRLREVQPDLTITDRDVEVVQLAGLVHDLGHGPYSHMFDGQFIPRTRPDLNGRYCHEEMTVKIFDELLKDNQIDVTLFGLDPVLDTAFIKECILGSKINGGVAARIGRSLEKAFMYDVISNVSSGMDVDRLDYFERDARNTCVKSGCDVQRLIAESRVANVDGQPRIVFPDKLVGDVLAAYQTRFRLHNAVYQHKVVKAIELMIVDALTAADRAGVFSFRGSDKRDYSLSHSIDDPVSFCLAQDDVLQQIRASRSIEALGARNLIKRLDTRQLYRSVGEVSIRRPNINMGWQSHETMMSGALSEGGEEFENPNTFTQIENQNPELYQLFDRSEDDIKRMLLETETAKIIELSESDVIVEKMRVHHGSYSNDPVQSVYFYSKSNPSKARKLARTKYENLCPATFMKEAIRVFCTSTSSNVISMVHEAFKELTKTRPFLSGKGTPMIQGGTQYSDDDDDGDDSSDDGLVLT